MKKERLGSGDVTITISAEQEGGIVCHEKKSSPCTVTVYPSVVLYGTSRICCCKEYHASDWPDKTTEGEQKMETCEMEKQ